MLPWLCDIHCMGYSSNCCICAVIIERAALAVYLKPWWFLLLGSEYGSGVRVSMVVVLKSCQSGLLPVLCLQNSSRRGLKLDKLTSDTSVYFVKAFWSLLEADALKVSHNKMRIHACISQHSTTPSSRHVQTCVHCCIGVTSTQQCSRAEPVAMLERGGCISWRRGLSNFSFSLSRSVIGSNCTLLPSN